MPHLPFRLIRRRGILTLPADLLATLQAEAWARWPMETGGILMGTADDGNVRVRHVIGPGPHAAHERYSFHPDDVWQAEQVAAAWHTDQTLEYLGDWHTHPGGTTQFSALDLATALSIAETPQARQPSPVMLVLATNDDLTVATAAARLMNRKLMALKVLTTSAS